MLEQANYMGRMVTDIVMLARDTPEKMALVETSTSLQSFASSVLDTMGSEAGRVDTRLDAGIEIEADLDRVRQLITNLLHNALRYGADQCELRLEARAADLIIEVHDNGPGVPKRYQQTIWERFERGGNQLNAMTPGTGLGLAIVEMIAKAHGGAGSYRKSEILGGACFSVVLPDRVVSSVERTEALRVASQPASVRSLSDDASAPESRKGSPPPARPQRSTRSQARVSAVSEESA